MRQKREGRSPGRSMSELGRRLTSPRRPGPEQSLKASSGSRASAADSKRGSSCLPPLPHHVRLALHGRQHRPPSGPSQRRSPHPETSQQNPSSSRPRFRPPFQGLPSLLLLPSMLKPPTPGLAFTTWIRFLCRLRSAMLAAPPGSL